MPLGRKEVSWDGDLLLGVTANSSGGMEKLFLMTDLKQLRERKAKRLDPIAVFPLSLRVTTSLFVTSSRVVICQHHLPGFLEVV